MLMAWIHIDDISQFKNMICLPYQIRELVNSHVVGLLAEMIQFVVLFNLLYVFSKDFEAVNFLLSHVCFI